MKKTRYTDEQIAFALRQAEMGTSVSEACRKMGVTDKVFTAGRKNMLEWAAWNCGG